MTLKLVTAWKKEKRVSFFHYPWSKEVYFIIKSAIDDYGSPTERQGSQESLDEETSLKRHSSQTSLLRYSSQTSLNESPSKKVSILYAIPACSVYLTCPHCIQSLDQEEDPPKKGTGLITEEIAETGTVKLSVMFAYIKACTWLRSGLTFLFYIGNSVMLMSANFWLAEWSNAEGRFNATNFTALTFCDHPDNIDV